MKLQCLLLNMNLKTTVDFQFLLEVPVPGGNPTAPQFTRSVTSACFTTCCIYRLTLIFGVSNCRFWVYASVP